jgi:hypothetical protein
MPALNVCVNELAGATSKILRSGAIGDLGGQITSLTQSMIGQKFGETLQGIEKGLSGATADMGQVPDLIKQLNPNIEAAMNFDISKTNPHAAALMGGGGSLPGGGGMLSQFGGGGAALMGGGNFSGDLADSPRYKALLAAHPDMAPNPLVALASSIEMAKRNIYIGPPGSSPYELTGSSSLPHIKEFQRQQALAEQKQEITINATFEMDGQAVGNAVVKTMAPRVGMAAQNMRRGSSMTTRA